MRKSKLKSQLQGRLRYKKYILEISAHNSILYHCSLLHEGTKT